MGLVGDQSARFFAQWNKAFRRQLDLHGAEVVFDDPATQAPGPGGKTVTGIHTPIAAEEELGVGGFDERISGFVAVHADDIADQDIEPGRGLTLAGKRYFVDRPVREPEADGDKEVKIYLMEEA